MGIQKIRMMREMKKIAPQMGVREIPPPAGKPAEKRKEMFTFGGE